MSAGRDREKVKETKKLVKLALDEGWTEAEIARKCRVTAEKVSTWKNGKARGRRHELKPLLDDFGWRLRRGKMRVYLVVDSDAEAHWKQTEDGQRMLADLEELKALEERHADLLGCLATFCPHRASASWTEDIGEARERAEGRLGALTARVEELRAAYAARLNGEDAPVLEEKRYVGREPRNLTDAEVAKQLKQLGSEESATARVAAMSDGEQAALERRQTLSKALDYAPEKTIAAALSYHAETHSTRPEVVLGRVVFSHAFTRPIQVAGRTARIRRFAMWRWRIHCSDDGQHFTLVRQQRWPLSPQRRAAWSSELFQAFGKSPPSGLDPYTPIADIVPGFVDSTDDAARWVSKIEPPMDLNALLAHVDASIHRPDRPHGPNDEVTLPFLLRKALIEQGFDVPGVVFHGAD